MKKLIGILVSVVLAVTLCLGCAPKDPLTLKFFMPMGAPALAAAQLMSQDQDLTVGNSVYSLDYSIVPSEVTAAGNITARVKTKEADIAILPVNAAAALLGAGGADNKYAGEYKILSVVTHGNLFLLKKGAVDSVKKVAVKNLNAVPGLTYKAVLGVGNYTDNLSQASADKVYLANIGEQEAPPVYLTEKGFDGIVLPEPACTNILATPLAGELGLQKVSLQAADVWGEEQGYAQAVLVVRTRLLTEAFASALLDQMEQAAAWLNASADGAATNASAILTALSEYNHSGVDVPFTSANLTADCVAGCNVYIARDADVRASCEKYLSEIAKIDITVKLPTADFYYAN